MQNTGLVGGGLVGDISAYTFVLLSYSSHANGVPVQINEHKGKFKYSRSQSLGHRMREELHPPAPPLPRCSTKGAEKGRISTCPRVESTHQNGIKMEKQQQRVIHSVGLWSYFIVSCAAATAQSLGKIWK